LDEALRQFEAAEANLSKLEKLWSLLEKNVPKELHLGLTQFMKMPAVPMNTYLQDYP
jgi:hypothetical protein